MDVLSRETLAEILAEEPSRKGRGKKFASFDRKSLSLFFFFDLNALILKSKGREEIDQQIFKFYELLLRNKNIVMIEKNTRKHKY